MNLNADLCAAWGYYEEVGKTDEPIAIIRNLKSDLFAGFKLEEDYDVIEGLNAMTFEAPLTGVKFGEFFADDDTLANNFAEDLVLMHAHNMYHNAYIYLPQEAVGSAKLLANAIDALKSSKSEITQAPAPKITLNYKDMKTIVSMAMASSKLPKAHIYYTLDGTDPTTESAEYTEPLTVTSETEIKAVAIARGFVAPAGVDLVCVPAFAEVEVEGEDRTRN